MDTSNDLDSGRAHGSAGAHGDPLGDPLGAPLGPQAPVSSASGSRDDGGDTFVPRPYPSRDPAVSPLRGRYALVLDRDIERGRRLAAALAAGGCAASHHPGGSELARVLGRDRWEVILVSGRDALPEDVRALAALPGSPALLCVGTRAEAEALGLESLAPDARDAEAVRAVGRALERRVLEDENRRLRERLAERHTFGSVVTRDPALREVLRTLEAVADTRATILVTGETGTGKSLLARAVHTCSARASAPFVEVNCGALPAGLLEAELFGHAKGAFTGADHARAGRFEVADGGTLFLDEVDSAPPELQVKLLRVLQERRFERVGESHTRTTDVRVIAATNAALDARVRDGSFREDLYWRLNVVAVRVPPLRDRPRDLVPLAQRFVERFAAEYDKPVTGLHPDALACLAAHRWPGNVRQLEHTLERAVLLARGTELTRADLGEELAPAAQPRPGALPGGVSGGVTAGAPGGNPGAGPDATLAVGLGWLAAATQLPSLRAALEEPERLILVRALELAEGRRDRAAKMLDINRSTLFNKMRKYGLLERSFGPDGA